MADSTHDSSLMFQARQLARSTLAGSTMFRAMSLPEQQDLYRSVVASEYDKLSRQHGLARPMAVEDFADYDPGFDNSTAAFNELVDSVDFPKFVADLLNAVFRANLSVMKSQTDDYIRLMKEATKATADFLKNVNDEDAFAYLVEQPNSPFNLMMEESPDGGQKLALSTPDGEPVDMDDNEVKAKIVDAKIAMAKEHRAALREVLLMGVTRLVVDKGEVEAAVEFRITATRDSRKSHSDQNVNTVNANFSYGGGLSGLFGGPRGSMSITNTNIQVNTSSQAATDELFAKLMGKVKIQFKTDYFKLDNFANMYSDGGIAALQPPPQQGLPAGLPRP